MPCRFFTQILSKHFVFLQLISCLVLCGIFEDISHKSFSAQRIRFCNIQYEQYPCIYTRYEMTLIIIQAVIFMFFFIDCPDFIDVTIHHKIMKNAKPSDKEINLTCIGSGISRDQLEYYWWLIHEINSPIYTYSVIAWCDINIRFTAGEHS